MPLLRGGHSGGFPRGWEGALGVQQCPKEAGDCEKNFGWGSVEGIIEEITFALALKKDHDFPHVDVFHGKGV